MGWINFGSLLNKISTSVVNTVANVGRQITITVTKNVEQIKKDTMTASMNAWVNGVRVQIGNIKNGEWDRRIKANTAEGLAFRNKINSIRSQINSATTQQQIINLYDTMYTTYESDDLMGIIDWSPSFTTQVCLGRGDCDNMGETWRALGRKYLTLGGYQVVSVKAYAFLNYERVNNVKQAHVMCVAEVVPTRAKGWAKYILFDYKNIQAYKTFDEIYRFYSNAYVGGANSTKVIHVEVKEPRSVTF